MAVLIIVLYIVFGLVTAALVSLVAQVMEQRGLDMYELVLVFFFWPYFLLALIVRVNSQ